MATGMDRETGRPLSGQALARQAVGDVLSTLVGQRVMRGRYGVDSTRIVDAPATEMSIARLRSRILDAVPRWVPEVEVERVTARVDPQVDGGRRHLTVIVVWKFLPSGTVDEFQARL